MEMIITSPDKLQEIVTAAVTRAIKRPDPVDPKPDRIGLAEALNETGLSKSKIYKLTAEGKIPFKKFGRLLIFSRKELKSWVEANTIRKNIKNEVAESLARRTKKKGASK